MKLKKDLVIPAGTVFKPAPKVVQYISAHVTHVFPIGPNECGTIVVPVEKDDPDFTEWFESE